MNWRTDREVLRKELREGKHTGQYATFLCCLVSHMRKKIHMKWYNKYHGGWRGNTGVEVENVEELSKDLVYAYEGYAKYYARKTYVGSLADQEQWIRLYLDNKIYFAKYAVFPAIPQAKLTDQIKEIAVRVLAGYDEEAKEVA